MSEPLIWGTPGVSMELFGVFSDDLVYAFTRVPIEKADTQLEIAKSIGAYPLLGNEQTRPNRDFEISRSDVLRAVAEYHECPYIRSFNICYEHVEGVHDGVDETVRYLAIELAKQRRGHPFNSSCAGAAAAVDYIELRNKPNCVTPPPPTPAFFRASFRNFHKMKGLSAYFCERGQRVSGDNDIDPETGVYVDPVRRIWESNASADAQDKKKLERCRNEYLSDDALRTTIIAFLGTKSSNPRSIREAMPDASFMSVKPFRILRHITNIAAHKNRTIPHNDDIHLSIESEICE